MLMLIASFVLFVVFAIIASVIFLLALHIEYFTALARKSADRAELRYFRFIAPKVTRRKLRRSLVLIPLCLVALIIIPTALWAPYRTRTLRSQLSDASSLKIRPAVIYTELPRQETILYETQDPQQIADLLNSIAFTPRLMGFTCACLGDMVCEFYDGDKLTGSFTIHHGVTIRIPNDRGGDYDLTHASIAALDDWLEARDIQTKLDKFTEKQHATLYDTPEPNAPTS